MARPYLLPVLLLWAAAAALSSLPALMLADPLSISVQISNPNDPGGGNENGNGNGGNGGGGSSGGGGGGLPPANANANVNLEPDGEPEAEPVPTTVTFSGTAYPGSLVTVLRDGQAVRSTRADSGARFQFSLIDVASGSYVFSLYGEDSRGRRSSLFTFPLTLLEGTVTTVGDIFIASTIDLDRDEIRRGEAILVFGESAPNALVTVSVHSERELQATATTDANGFYERSVDTASLEVGDHSAKARATAESRTSPYGQSIGFKVGDRNVGRGNVCSVRADLTGECRVSLIDFSVLAYWYGRANPPTAVDLKQDGRVDIFDFSIMAYYWTG